MAAMKSFRYHIREMRREDLEEVTALEAACFSLPWKYRDFEEVLTAASVLSALLRLGEERYGITAYTLEVRSRNIPARRLYEKNGFVSRGVRPGFYQKPEDDAVIMWRA